MDLLMYQFIIKKCKEYGSWTKPAIITVRGRCLFQSYLRFTVLTAELLLQLFNISLSLDVL